MTFEAHGRDDEAPTPEEAPRRRRAPTSEEAPASPVPIHLTDADLTKPVACIKGIRAALTSLARAADAESRVPIHEAEALWDRFVAGERPLLLGTALGQARAREAAEAALWASARTVKIAVGLNAAEIATSAAEHIDAEVARAANPEDAGKPMNPGMTALDDGDPPADWLPSVVAAKLALNLLAQHDGVPAAAFAWARIMGENDRSGPWQDVRWLLLSSFPMKRG